MVFLQQLRSQLLLIRNKRLLLIYCVATMLPSRVYTKMLTLDQGGSLQTTQTIEVFKCSQCN